ALFVPTVLVLVIAGWRSMRQTLPVTLVIGISFAIAQWLCATYFSYELTDIVASLVGLGVAVLFLQVWKPKGADEARERILTPEALAKPVDANRNLLPGATWMALFPYVLVILIFGVAKLWRLGVDIPAALAATDVKFGWPGLHGNIVDGNGEAVSSTIYLSLIHI
ncbi:L-lactate permease, partial [Blastococcus sp. TBT05-19]|uniref:L-lactate permease n=1 Tax=Blastococcus sp. TBT05-19 TaxID=2250581 RepID=UPI000E034317